MTNLFLFSFLLAAVAFGALVPKILDFVQRRSELNDMGARVDREIWAGLPAQIAQLDRAQELGLPLGPIRAAMDKADEARQRAALQQHLAARPRRT
jgi:hypothetical protein